MLVRGSTSFLQSLGSSGMSAPNSFITLINIQLFEEFVSILNNTGANEM